MKGKLLYLVRGFGDVGGVVGFDDRRGRIAMEPVLHMLICNGKCPLAGASLSVRCEQNGAV
jgi:hypothetical protein